MWLYPRGPDSGFKVYPGFGNRFTYFGTSPVAHALNEPAWIVRELGRDESPLSNGLPIFPIYYSNDDDPDRKAGKDSVIYFSPPNDDTYYIRIRDTRGMAGDEYRYQLSIAPPKPNFVFRLDTPEVNLRPDVGAEFAISAERFDGLDSEIKIEFEGIPEGVTISQPLTIERGQFKAIGQIRANGPLATNEFNITLAASCAVDGKLITAPTKHQLKVKVNEKPTMKLKVVAMDGKSDGTPLKQLRIRPGETVSAKLVIERGEHQGDIAFGGDDSGRNLPHGCFVDNIGLNGLLIPAGQTEREVFITASPIVPNQHRMFHLRANVDGNPTSLPIELIVE